MARRIGWDEPSLTLTCSPPRSKQNDVIQKKLVLYCQEYARIQTFPDEWQFGPMAQQYKQIGNAVPVNLAKEVGYSIISFK